MSRVTRAAVLGRVFKNLALGCMAGPTRAAMHDTMQYDPYWYPEKCPDEETRQRIKNACPFEALVDDKDNPNGLHLHPEQCNACGRCLLVAPEGSLKIDPVNFHSFQEACAISTKLCLETFAPDKVIHINLATQMTPVCDCFGFTSMPILPDAGIFGSNDIVAIDRAVLDASANMRLIEENMPSALEVHTRSGHPFQWLHGPLKNPYLVTDYGHALGLGSIEYEIVDVLPVRESANVGSDYIPAQ